MTVFSRSLSWHSDCVVSLSWHSECVLSKREKKKVYFSLTLGMERGTGKITIEKIVPRTYKCVYTQYSCVRVVKRKNREGKKKADEKRGANRLKTLIIFSLREISSENHQSANGIHFLCMFVSSTYACDWCTRRGEKVRYEYKVFFLFIPY